MWLLDTNICIYLIKKKPELVLQRLRRVDIDLVSVSSITVAELQYGVNEARVWYSYPHEDSDREPEEYLPTVRPED